MFTKDQDQALKGKLDPGHTKKRDGFDYIEAWRAMETANEIFGFEGWDRETDTRMTAEYEREMGPENRKYMGWAVSYTARSTITVRAGDVVIRRQGTGAGHGYDRDRGKAHESAIKEAESDAMKRALSSFGNRFGLALYDKERAGVGFDWYAKATQELDACATKTAYKKWRKWFADEKFIDHLDGDQVKLIEGKAKDVKEKLGITEDAEERKKQPPAEKAKTKAKKSEPKKKAAASKKPAAEKPSPNAKASDEPGVEEVAPLIKELSLQRTKDDLIEWVAKNASEIQGNAELEEGVRDRAKALGFEIGEGGEIIDTSSEDEERAAEEAEKFKEAFLKTLKDERRNTIELVDRLVDKYRERLDAIAEDYPVMHREIFEDINEKRKELADDLVLDDDIPI